MKKDNKAIILTDGGICSQIAFYVLGKYLEDLGYEIKYDLTWFKKNGKDCNGVHARNYIMDVAFPELNIGIASDKEALKFEKKYAFPCKTNVPLNKLKEKMYIYGYPKERMFLLGKYAGYLKKTFNPIDKNEVEEIIKEVKNKNSCAIHVRRGDLSGYVPEYGYPPDKDYFLKAMDIIVKLAGEDVEFYLFSDEPEWVKKNLLPYVNYNCKLVNRNDSARGHLDLYIMSRCKNIIASQGSFGSFAKILNINDKSILITPTYQDFLHFSFSNIITLNQKPLGETLQLQQKNKFEKYKKWFNVTLITNIIFILITVVLSSLLFLKK